MTDSTTTSATASSSYTNSILNFKSTPINVGFKMNSFGDKSGYEPNGKTFSQSTFKSSSTSSPIDSAKLEKTSESNSKAAIKPMKIAENKSQSNGQKANKKELKEKTSSSINLEYKKSSNWSKLKSR